MASTPHDFVSGELLTAAQMDKMPQGIFAVASSTSAIGPTSSTTELDIVTAAAVTLLTADRQIRLRFHARGISVSVADGIHIVRIKEGATVLNEAHYNPAGTGVASIAADFEAIVSSPTAASHTYKATIQRSSGTGNATVSATATAPITLTVEDVGQA